MDRLERLRARLQTENLDAVLISSDANRRYLSGFTGSAGFLLVSRERALLISDGRYTVQAAQQAPGWEWQLIAPPKVPLTTVLKQVLPTLQVQRLGFEAAHLTVAQWAVLSTELKGLVEFAPSEGLVEQLREQKDPAEQALLARASAITDAAFAAVRPLLRPTMREREVAWELEQALRAAGADRSAFEIIVAAGPNSARPHARPSDEQLGWGRPIVMDFGALVDGYHGDMTRTVILGEADERFTTLYQHVLRAYEHAAANVRVGMSGSDADALARDTLAAAGLAEAFGHSLGHGVGLVIHEGPSLRQGTEAPLPVDAVFSIEPGVYLPEWGGIRIEDLVLLEATGPRALAHASKDPLVIWE